jgi:aspartate/methionine/tyrosine aminotransferase
MSKTYGLAGLRIGWVATRNRRVLEEIAKVKDYTTICNSAPSEFLAILALRHRERIVDRNLGIVGRNMPLLEAFLDRRRDIFSWVKPEAGPIAFPRLELEADDLAFCAEAVERSGVMLLPGAVYDHPGHFRIGFGRASMPEALERFDAHLSGRFDG